MHTFRVFAKSRCPTLVIFVQPPATGFFLGAGLRRLEQTSTPLSCGILS